MKSEQLAVAGASAPLDIHQENRKRRTPSVAWQWWRRPCRCYDRCPELLTLCKGRVVNTSRRLDPFVIKRGVRGGI